ncbi:hypothetical protein MMC31_008081 [Peltigera leucophlebia]|nr:hypothetical protein [Peltigera leucophlebia]
MVSKIPHPVAQTSSDDAARKPSYKSDVSIIAKDGRTSRAHIDERDNDGRTLLHDVAREKLDCVSYKLGVLLRRGADINARDNDGRTPLHNATRADSIATLLDRGADIDARDNDGRTPLHNVARSGSKNDILLLLNGGADINATDNDGRPPLFAATQAGVIAPLLWLLSPEALTFVNYDVDTVWKGLETYQNLGGAISDILTISRLQDHLYIARSVSEFLSEYYPAFGLRILNWITRICEKCQELEKKSSSPNSISVKSGVSKTRETKQVVITGAECAIVAGYLEAGQMGWKIYSRNTKLALDINFAISWTLSAIRPQDAEGLFCWEAVSLDVGLPEIAKFSPSRIESYCWTSLFSYACIAVLPSLHYVDHSGTEGLEIEFNLLLELAAIDREILTEDGLILFGFDTALIPLKPPESRRWHFLVTDGRQITPARVKKEFDKMKQTDGKGDFHFKGKLEPRFRNGKVYVGWCAAPVVTIGTIDSDTAAVYDISMSSGLSNVIELEESMGRSSGNEVSFMSRIGFLGSSIGASGGKKTEKKFQQVNVVAKRTQKSSFEGILASARATPCIMWDQSVERAWLVSAVSTLFFASLRYARWNKYTFKRKQTDGRFEPAELDHAREDLTDTTSGSESALRQSQMLLVDKAAGFDVNDEISFGDIVKQMWLEMADGEDICISSTTGSKHNMNESIFGYDLNEAICGTRKHLRTLPVSPCIQSWQPLAQVKMAQIIFCKDVGTVVRCKSVLSYADCCARAYPKGALSCLLQDLRVFYGERWDKPLNPPAPLSIGNGYEWVPSGCESLSQEVCSRSLQSIVASKPQRKKLKRRQVQILGKQKEGGKIISLLPREFPALVTFGFE